MTIIALIITMVFTPLFTANKEMVTMIAIFTAFAIIKFIVRIMLSIVFQVIKWIVILAVIGLLFASIL